MTEEPQAAKERLPVASVLTVQGARALLRAGGMDALGFRISDTGEAPKDAVESHQPAMSIILKNKLSPSGSGYGALHNSDAWEGDELSNVASYKSYKATLRLSLDKIAEAAGLTVDAARELIPQPGRGY